MHIITELDQITLQEDVNALVTWSSTTDMNFNLKKTVHLSFKCKAATSYYMFDTVTTGGSRSCGRGTNRLSCSWLGRAMQILLLVAAF